MLKKLFNLAQWAVLIAIVIFMVRNLTKPVPPPDYNPDSWTSWRGFYALSYAGVTREGGTDYVTPRQLASHLHALREAGYETISTGDVEAFLNGRTPLPDRALLLLFEGGRKDSYISATPLLRQFGQMATMCVPTVFTRWWGSFYLHTSDLKKFLKHPHWGLASMGHEAVLPIPVGKGEEGRFLARRKWLKTRFETSEEYAARITNDFARAAGILAHAATRPVPAYLFPFADAGTSPGATPEAEETLRGAVAAYHHIAFSRADDAYNGPDAEPLQLARLRVRGDWDARQLLDELAKCEPRPEPVTGPGGTATWSLDGSGTATTGSLSIAAGSRAWLRGSSDWSDLEVSAEITRETNAATALYLRYAGPTRYIRLLIDDNGIRAQERIGAVMQTLAFQAVTNGAAPESRIAIRTRGNRLWFTDGQKPTIGPLPLTRFTTRGRIGFEAIGSNITIHAFSARLRSNLVVRADTFRQLDQTTQEAASMWLAPWFNLDRPPEFSASRRSELIAAASRGIQVVPIVDGAADSSTAAAFLKQWDASLSDVTAHALITQVALTTPDTYLAEGLRKRGYGILFDVSADQARALARTSRLGRDRDVLLLSGNALEVGEAIAELQHELPPTRLIWKTDKETYLPPGVRRAVSY